MKIRYRAGDMMKKKSMADESEFRKLRIKAGFVTMRDAADYTKTKYRTWQNWELEITPPLEVVYLYLELFIKTKQNPYPK